MTALIFLTTRRWYLLDLLTPTTVTYRSRFRQPVGTGFSNGTSDVQNEHDIADRFYGFLFVSSAFGRPSADVPLCDSLSVAFCTRTSSIYWESTQQHSADSTFPDLLKKKLFIAGESYAG